MQIAVFKNRVEIRSPGGLYGDMTIEKMLHGNVSKRRNPLIANLLRRIQMVEAWGRGMPLILKNAPNVTFREISHIFIASFDRPSFLEEEETGFATEENTKEKPKKRQRTIKETIKEKPKTTKETILDAIIEKPSISVKDLAVLCGLSTPGVQFHINNLKKSGIIRHMGSTKTGHWEILK